MVEIMTAAEIAELRKLEAAATPGPWGCARPDDVDGMEECAIAVYTASELAQKEDAPSCIAAVNDNWGEYQSNAALIAAARNALPRLLATIEALLAEDENKQAGFLAMHTALSSIVHMSRAVTRAAAERALAAVQVDNERLRAALETAASIRAALKGGDSDA